MNQQRAPPSTQIRPALQKIANAPILPQHSGSRILRRKVAKPRKHSTVQGDREYKRLGTVTLSAPSSGIENFSIAGWGSHPLESAALSRRTPKADIDSLASDQCEGDTMAFLEFR
jgi:hypothetical protein